MSLPDGQEILVSCSVTLDGAYSSVDTADKNDEKAHSCFVPGTGGRDLNFIVDSILCDFSSELGNSPLLTQPGGPPLPGSHYVDAELSMDTQSA